MSMATGGSSGGMQSDINITPLIDVLLVLLVIFMITQPMLRKVLDIQVPVEQPATPAAPTNNIVLEIKDDGTYAINTQVTPHDQLLARLREIYGVRAEKLLFIKVGQHRKYKDVIDAIDIARGAGVTVFGLAPPETAAPGG
jgi:biopolymer transport protein ExbD